MIRSLALTSTLLALALPLPGRAAADTWVLRGAVVTPDAVIEDGAVTLTGAKIAAVGPWAAPVPGTKVVETKGIIYPGLIDLHNHLTWNVFPRWKAGRTWPNRYEWQQYVPYLMALATPHEALIKEGYGFRMAQYAEVKALAGGVTSLAGLYPGDLPDDQKTTYHQLIRMIDINSGFYPAGTPEPVAYQVFPLFVMEAIAAKYRADLASHQLKSLLIHLGEGSPVDAASINEFRILKARGLLLPGVALIHGVALHKPQFEEMQKAGVGLVWSPRSNFELYGATADIAAAKAAHITIALAPDWSPTGSGGLLDELKFAALWNASLHEPLVTDKELFHMATSEAAKLAGAEDKIGAIKPGLYADLLVLNRAQGDVYANLDHASPGDVALVVINGQAVYGEPSLAKAAATSTAWTELTVGPTTKVVAFPVPTPNDDWSHITSALDAAMVRLGSHLGPLVE